MLKLQEFRIVTVQSITSVYKVANSEIRLVEELKIEETEESVTVYVCKRKSKLAICSALAPLLGLDPLALTMIVQTDPEELDAWFKSEGIPEIEAHAYQPWMPLDSAGLCVDSGAGQLLGQEVSSDGPRGEKSKKKAALTENVRKNGVEFSSDAAQGSRHITSAASDNHAQENATAAKQFFSSQAPASQTPVALENGGPSGFEHTSQYEVENGIQGEIYVC